MGKHGRSLLCVLVLASLPPLIAAKAQTTDPSKITALVGANFTKMFSTFGTPTDLYTVRATETTDDYVVVDYTTFGFKVRNKIVTMAIFWKEYAGIVNGISIGDEKEEALAEMGDTDDISENSDGTTNYFWELDDCYFGVVFDDDDTVQMIKVQTK